MNGKQVIVGITGGIAAYKAAELVRLLVKADAYTRVAMTRHATQFVTPLTFEALSGNPVIWEMFDGEGGSMAHIHWGQEADLIIIAPATANFIAKMAHGIGDDFLSTLILAATAKVLVCPSMNSHMYTNPGVQENLQTLKGRGIAIMEPEVGDLACKTEGAGRLPDPQEIFREAILLLSPKDLTGLKVLVTAGPTSEPIDPVRYITNRSSGKMGYALAWAARRRGGQVILVSGPTGLKPPPGITLVNVQTARDMRDAVLGYRKGCDMIIKAAAVSDYRPSEAAPQKIKKGAERLTLEMIRNPDILAELGATRGNDPCVLVGFAAETQELLVNARKKLLAKNLDMIVANDVSRGDTGFQADTNQVKILFRDGCMEETQLLGKDEVADLILERAKELLQGSHDCRGRI